MKTTFKFIVIVVLSVAVLASCKKKEDNPAPTNTSTTATGDSTSIMSNFFSQNGVVSQTFTINPSTLQLVSGSGGIRINIPANSFVTSTNGAVTGNISIELRELYSKKDMILSGMVPTSGVFPLISGGEFFIKATQGGQTLKLSSTATVTVNVPAGSNPSYQMNEFYASVSTSTDSSGWISNNDSLPIAVVQDSIYPSSYNFRIDSMNWINCDYYWNDPAPKTLVMANTGSQFNDSNCVVFMSVNGQNSIGQLRYYSSSFQSQNWPTGKAVTFVAIAEISGQYYSAFKGSTLVMNHLETLTLATTTLSQIQSQLSTLP